MELLPGFLPAALAAMRDDARLAAVGGSLIEMSDGLEFRERQLRADASRRPGLVDHVTGCALYRTTAIQDVGYFMDRNLHCFEEFELGQRLRTKKWQLRMLDVPCVRHYGHRDASVRLLVRRWRTRFLHGYDELLRAAWGRPHLLEATKPCRLPLLVLGWWVVLLGLAVAAAVMPGLLPALGFVVAFPFLALLARKRNLERAAYAWLMWQFSAASLLAGLCSRRVAPSAPLDAVVLQDVTTVAGRAAAAAPLASAPSVLRQEATLRATDVNAQTSPGPGHREGR